VGASSHGLNLVAGSGPKEEATTGTHRPYYPGLNTTAGFNLEENAADDEDCREEEAATNPRRASSRGLDSTAMVRSQGKGGGMRKGGVVAPPCSSRTFIRPLLPTAREAASAGDGISRVAGGGMGTDKVVVFSLLETREKDCGIYIYIYIYSTIFLQNYTTVCLKF
jgi:hypothetical protein